MGIGPSGRVALDLLACCPHVPTDVVAGLLQLRHTRSAAQLLGRLRTAGLVRYGTLRPGPLVGSRRVRLWTVTRDGSIFMDRRRVPRSKGAGKRQLYGAPKFSRTWARPRGTPTSIGAYRLLAHVVRSMDRPVRVAAWEGPWVRTLVDNDVARTRYVRLPAGAVLIQGMLDGEQVHGVLLLPDFGTLPVACYRSVLRGLIELRVAAEVGGVEEPLLIVGVAVAVQHTPRIAAWHSLLKQVARQSGEQPPRANVIAWSEGLAVNGQKQSALGDQADQVLGLVARHPLLEQRQLAALLDTSAVRVGHLIHRLTSAGWIRCLRPANTSVEPFGAPHSGRPSRLMLIELTPAGRREAARQLLAPASVAARHHGLLGREKDERFARHLAHTAGANAVFVAFVVAGRRTNQRSGDDGLEEWRSAAACARGRFRPDGYACYRRGGSRFGFFLEFDRGTEKPREYAAKIATYYRYRDSGTAARDYTGFPTLLVVTTSELAEERFVYQAYLAAQRHGGTPLSVFLTTTRRIRTHPEGVLGAIWCGPGRGPVHRLARAAWLPR
jgi:hypothetical protein